MTNLIITTPEDLARIFEEVLARHQPQAQPEAGLMKLAKVPDNFVGLSVKQVERWGNERLIQIYRPYPGADRYIDTRALAALIKSYDAVTGEKIAGDK